MLPSLCVDNLEAKKQQAIFGTSGAATYKLTEPYSTVGLRQLMILSLDGISIKVRHTDQISFNIFREENS